MNEISGETLGIAGSGTIACGLAVAAASEGGGSVILRARSRESADKARTSIDKQAGRFENAEEVCSRIAVTTELADLSGCSFVIEAIAEDAEVKSPLLSELNDLLDEDAIIGSTTSSLSVADLAERCGRAERFVGFHVFNPVTKMRLIEIVYGPEATDDTKSRSRGLCDALGKTGIEVPDTPGFVVNRLLFPYLFDAAAFLQESDMTAEDVDKAMMFGTGHPMGPLAVLDYVGLDISIAIGEHVGCNIPQNARDLLNDGKLGRKTGEGFYKYD